MGDTASWLGPAVRQWWNARVVGSAIPRFVESVDGGGRRLPLWRAKEVLCPQQFPPQCMKQPPTSKYGRMVYKSDYQKEHERARAKATTAKYQEIRREHWKVERKLAEIMNCHGGCRARSRGHVPVFIQECMASTTTNIKRIIKLLSGSVCAPTAEI